MAEIPDSQTYENYLADIVELFRENGQAAMARAKSDPAQALFHEGRALAYAEALSSMQSRADIFGLRLDEIGLSGFDPVAEISAVEESRSDDRTRDRSE